MSGALQKTDKLNEGKTKIIWKTTEKEKDLVIVESKDDITAGDGAKHDVLPNKGAWSTTTTCNVFWLLRACGIPVAFQEQLGATCFVAKKCNMIPLEVVVRREGHGSFLKRQPQLAKGHIFPQLVCELYLKTSGKKWDNHELPCDDPMIVLVDDVAKLYVPSKPLWEQKPFQEIPIRQVIPQLSRRGGLFLIQDSARRIFLVLEKAWQILGHRLVDFKIEFGLYKHEFGLDVLLSDVIDSDSWRKLNTAGEYSDKQIYRDGGPLAEVAAKFQEAAELTSQFRIPRQQIVLWSGSNSDDVSKFIEELKKLCHSSVMITPIVCSVHKEPVAAYRALHQAVQEIPDSVVIAYVGMSNGAGPTLSANCTVPVITVPATVEKSPEDVWSSLRNASNVPVMTVLNPSNAVLAALQILASRNPALYANLRFEQEKRLSNFSMLG